MRYLRSLEHLAAVTETARTRSPVRAARALGCAPSSIYRAIDRFECEIAQPLFVRDPVAGWEPTEAGRELMRLGDRIVAEIAETELKLVGSGAGSLPAVVRVSASDGLAGWFLPPVLAEFARARPGVAIELISDNQLADLARREADIAVRPDQRPGDALVGRRAGKMAHALYAASGLIAREGVPHGLEDLHRFDICVLTESMRHFTSEAWRRGPAARALQRVPLRFNSETALAAAVAAGAGLGVLPCFIGARLAGVQRIDGIVIAAPVDIWLVSHHALRGNALVGGLMRHLGQAFRRDATSFL